jgi:branched-chain amino acid transport system substrate-binding protein
MGVSMQSRTLLVTVASGLAVVAMTAAGCSSSSKSSSPTSASGATTGATTGATSSGSSGSATSAIKIGFITDATGSASSTWSTSEIGAKARFQAQNQQGGVDGHPIDVITADGMSTPAGNGTAMEYLISQGVFGIIDNSSFAFGGAHSAQVAGIPVTGPGIDGPEWGTQPYTNMFATLGGQNPQHPEVQADIPATALFHYLGIKNVGALAYGISPSSVASVKDLKTDLDTVSIPMGYENLSLAFGTSDVTPEVLALKSAGVDMVVCSCVQSTVLAMISGLKQAGDNANSLSLSSADSTLFQDPTATASAQGLYFSAVFPPFGTNNAATTTFANELKAVDPGYQIGSYPSLGPVAAYESADLMIKGLEAAGSNPTRSGFISSLTKVTGYTDAGLSPYPVSFNHFGTSEKTYCSYYVKVVGKGFVPVNNGAAFCGPLPSGLQ